jgi:hypothetical protein
MGSHPGTFRLAIALFGISATALLPAGAEKGLRSLVEDAVSADAASSRAAIAKLRAAGPAGLDLLLEKRDPSDRICWTGTGGAPKSPEEGRWCAAVEEVARQRDASVSGLFWHTDLQEARTAARAERKPIVSLRLLGRLDEDFSCANSRFFRIALYPDPQIAALLRERFILHWSSERPAPRITVDFGDGRSIRQPITGNSVHYLLNEEGRVIDALPGLVGPGAFRRWLEESAEAPWMRSAPALASYHAGRLAALEDALRADQRRAGRLAIEASPRSTRASVPTVFEAAVVTMTKAAVEAPMLRAFLPGESEPSRLTREAWSAIAALHPADARLSPAARALLSRESGERPISSGAFRELEALMAIDTVRNEYIFHRRIHRWFAEDRVPSDLEGLNEMVYRDLFLTPRSDPWLGLLPGGLYTALTGVIVR